MADDLFAVRNNFYLGNFQACVNEGESLNLKKEELIIERDSFVYRSHVELGNNKIVIDDIKESAPGSLQAIKIWAQYRDGQNKDTCLTKIKKLLDSSPEETVLIIAALIYLAENNVDEALRIAVQTSSLEGRALIIQLYLRQERLDLAQKELKSLLGKDDDATISQLAQAWVNIATGGEKLQEAFYIYQEMGDKFANTPLILNGQAVCNMKRGRWEDAEGLLLEALEKNPKYGDTLTNLSCVSNHLGKPDRYTRQLKSLGQPHPWLDELKKFDQSFERAAARFAVSE